MKEIDLVTVIIVPVGLAILGYLFTHWHKSKLERNKNRLERINRQLDEFYGPLLSIVQSNEMAWKSFVSRYDKGSDFHKKESNPSESDSAEFLNWMDTVFMPNNKKLYKIIVEKTSLLRDNQMPEPLLELLAHYLEYRIALDDLKKRNVSEAVEVKSRYPGRGLLSYCRKHFEELKEEQSKLV